MLTKNIGIIVLAAGGSSRLGQPKQEILFSGKTLLYHAIESAAASKVPHVVVVISENVSIPLSEFAAFPVHFVDNPDWAKGVSTSIKTGLRKLLALNKDIEAVVITLCDQFLVRDDSIVSLIKKYRESGRPIVASDYDRTVGVPALFAREMFDELFELEGDAGAKYLIKYSDDWLIDTVDMPEAAFDMDTPYDLERLNEVQ